MGTWGFMAPEVCRREVEPNAATDRFSLAILLFYIFMLGHPLKGKRELELAFDKSDIDGSRRLCGDDPVFVFDPANASNRPIPGSSRCTLQLLAYLSGVIARALPSFLHDRSSGSGCSCHGE